MLSVYEMAPILSSKREISNVLCPGVSGAGARVERLNWPPWTKRPQLFVYMRVLRVCRL